MQSDGILQRDGQRLHGGAVGGVAPRAAGRNRGFQAISPFRLRASRQRDPVPHVVAAYIHPHPAEASRGLPAGTDAFPHRST